MRDTIINRRWSRRTILATAFVLALPFMPVLLQNVFITMTFAQFLYAELGILAALMCLIVIQVKADWAKLLAALVFLALSLLPLCVARFTFGEWRGMLSGTTGALWLSCAFLVVLLAAWEWYFKRHETWAPWFTWTMCLVALGLHALVFPALRGEPLRSAILHVANSGAEIIETNPEGTLLLTHSALAPVEARLYAHDHGELTMLRQAQLTGYPVGIRVRDDHALIALRVMNEKEEVERIDFVRFSASGVEEVGTYPCTATENPSHLINNLSPDGALLALADGACADVATGTRRALPPLGADLEGPLEFLRWTEPEGEAVFRDESRERLIVFRPTDSSVEILELGKNPEANLPSEKEAAYQYRLILRNNGQPLWYEVVRSRSGSDSLILPEGIESPPALFSATSDTATDGASPPDIAGRRITHITGSRALVSLNFGENGNVDRERHTQLLDVTAHATLARDSDWLFWVTQAPYGEGMAIHGKQLR